MALEAPVTVLPGVGPRHALTLERLGISVLRDMLYYFPRRYDDYTQLKPINRLQYGEEVTVIGTIQSIYNRPIRSGKAQIVEAVVSDGSGALRVTWFNQPWQARRLRPGTHLSLSGKVEQYLGRAVMNSPEWEPLEQQQLSTNRIVPVYPLTAQITQRWLRRTMNSVVTYAAPRVQDYLPENVRKSAGLIPLSTALLQVHFPDSGEKLKAARHRLAFDEIFLLQFGVLRQKRAWQERSARRFETDEEWLAGQVALLPYSLTGAQQHAIEDVRADLASGRPMNRLLQGDVGSGKTVVAALAVAIVAHSGAQSALMAPTSILAEQHYSNLLKLLSGSDGALQAGEIRLMVGATPEAEKREIRAGLADGSIKLVIGTHALIEDPVAFSDLELVIVDEQHRFGVDQRAALRSKGSNPHLLVMTATPIPRSLALTVYGDLELSVMDEMPPGRQPVSTHVLAPRERERAYSLVRSQVEAGRQAFIIYPLVEESDKSDAKAAVEEQARLQAEIFPKYKVGLLHGRMRPEEKEAVMADFRDRKTHVLVSTSVVEVGVDVPNATVMIIEGANRFGLAQLHQFRGRVGRGGEQSYCLLIPETPDSMENERLQVMAETNDGFVLAERDLEQRGPGQFLGTRQSGYSELQLAKLTDVHLIEKARKHAQALFDQDPELERTEHQFLVSVLRRFWGDGKGDIS
jgi:ATP-dependent DNA helicase RecG